MWSQSLFYWIIYSYSSLEVADEVVSLSQSLFYWIIYSYNVRDTFDVTFDLRLNPYFIGLSTLMTSSKPHTDS